MAEEPVALALTTGGDAQWTLVIARACGAGVATAATTTPWSHSQFWREAASATKGTKGARAYLLP